MFNQGGYYRMVQNGQLHEKLMRDGHPSPPLAPEPFCTRSQMVLYLDSNGRKVALVHQYLRTDGTIGASGRPDPKQLVENGTLYYS